MTGACLSMQNSHTNMKAYPRDAGAAVIYLNVADRKKKGGSVITVVES